MTILERPAMSDLTRAKAGFEQSRIKIILGGGWFVLLRLYGPLEPILNKEWRPNDIELVNKG